MSKLLLRKKLTPIHVDRASHERPATQISRQLEALILDGRYPANSKLPAHNELAAQLGVSGATVQKAMNELVERGLVTRTRRLGTFVAGLPSANPTRGKLGLVFWHQPRVEDVSEWGPQTNEWSYFRTSVELAIELGMQLTVDNWEQLGRQRVDLTRHFAAEENYRLVLLFNARFADVPAIRALAHGRPQVALMNAMLPDDPQVSSICSDFAPAARAAGQRLEALGHRRAVVLGGAQENEFVMSGIYTDACRSGLAAAGIEPVVVHSPQEMADVMRDERRRPTAVVKTSNAPAFQESFAVLRELGLSIPADVSVIGAPSEIGQPIGQVAAPCACLKDRPDQLVRIGLHALAHIGDSPIQMTMPASFIDGASIAPARVSMITMTATFTSLSGGLP